VKFQPHPTLPNGYVAFVGKYSFLALKHEGSAGWHTSWQDQELGGSASNTIEGPFKSRFAAEANCRRIWKQLQQKN
jgi:hypothetical protein